MVAPAGLPKATENMVPVLALNLHVGRAVKIGWNVYHLDQIDLGKISAQLASSHQNVHCQQECTGSCHKTGRL